MERLLGLVLVASLAGCSSAPQIDDNKEEASAIPAGIEPGNDPDHWHEWENQIRVAPEEHASHLAVLFATERVTRYRVEWVANVTEYGEPVFWQEVSIFEASTDRYLVGRTNGALALYTRCENSQSPAYPEGCPDIDASGSYGGSASGTLLPGTFLFLFMMPNALVKPHAEIRFDDVSARMLRAEWGLAHLEVFDVDPSTDGRRPGMREESIVFDAMQPFHGTIRSVGGPGRIDEIRGMADGELRIDLVRHGDRWQDRNSGLIAGVPTFSGEPGLWRLEATLDQTGTEPVAAVAALVEQSFLVSSSGEFIEFGNHIMAGEGAWTPP